MCIDETPVKLETVHRFESQEERDAFALAMQWPEERDAFARLIAPTNLNELSQLFKA